MFEPRGHSDMYGTILTELVNEDSDFGLFFLHNEGYSTMCGYGFIAFTQVALQTGMIETKEPITQIKIDTPAGLVSSYTKVKNGKVESVYFHQESRLMD